MRRRANAELPLFGGDRLAGVLTGHEGRDRRHVQALLDTVQAVSRLAPLDQVLTEVVDRCLEIASWTCLCSLGSSLP